MAVFICPVKNARLTSKYNLGRKHPVTHVVQKHAGIDLVGNATILAAADGKVRLIKDMGSSGYGKYIILTHTIGDQVYETVYAHLKSFNVKVGQVVKQGQAIGIMGNTGIGTGVHLHFEIHRGTYDYANGTYPKSINPEPIVFKDFNMRISKAGLDLIKKYEGFKDKSYLCPAKVWTIGWGTTRWPHAIEGRAVKSGEKISLGEANFIVEQQVNEHAEKIWKYIKVALTQSQFDALASFAYNLGGDIFAKDPALTAYINKKDWANTTRVMLKYIKADGKPQGGLVKRRADEVALFQKWTITNTPKGDDDVEFANKELEAMYKIRHESKATKELLATSAAKHLNLTPKQIEEGDLNTLALELAVYYARAEKENPKKA